ncbi:hypothetical protein, partial [Georgenia subflava]
LLGDDRISNFVVEDNLFNGGNYTINAGGDAVDSAVYRGNEFGTDYRYGVFSSGSTSTFDSSNTWHGTTHPVDE